MFRIPLWLFLLLLPLLFFGGCVASLAPVWRWTERGWTHPVADADKGDFPVLVRESSGRFATARLLRIPPGAVIVTSGFDEGAINSDLNAAIGAPGHHKFFKVREDSPDKIRVTLEVPTRHNSRLQSWYTVHNGVVVPERIMRYGPGFAFATIPLTAGFGIAAVVLFVIFVRPQAPTGSKQGS